MMKIPPFYAMAFIALSAGARINYPAAPVSDVSDTYFEIKVADPYRPLENDTASETLDWVRAQRALTDDYFSKIPFRNAIREQLAGLQDYVRTGLPTRQRDGRFYYFENSGLENQSTLYRSDSLDGQREVFIDPNKLSDDGTVALTGVYMSPDGRYTAYTISRSGSDWTEIYLLDTETKQLLGDHIEWAKFTGVQWHGNGFYYSAYGVPEKGKEFSEANLNHRIYYHELGTPQSEDTLFYEDPEHPLHFHSVYVPIGTDYIFVMASGEGFGSSIMVKNLAVDGDKWKILEPTQDVIVNLIDVKDDTVYFTTSLDAPRYRLMSAPLASPGRENWTELIPESDGVLSYAGIAKNKLIVNYNKDASDRLGVYNLDGTFVRDIDLPALGSVGFSTDKDHGDVFYSVTSYIYPWINYSYDIETGLSKMIGKAVINGFNPDDYITEEVFYPSSDGERIHMFLTRRKDVKPDGSNPVYLYGYGGFNVSLTPGFSTSRIFWLENGGIYAEANLRGGAEYGDEWHVAGTKMNKKNVFNDFISAGEYLVREGWTTPDRLVIEGGSNGGLLVGACVNMRPDLFRVAIPRVGVMDMMRYHLFTIGWNWAPDYGTSDDSAEMAAYLYSYSPLHNIKNDGTRYPAILVTTADHDDRVVPAHSFKYAAMLQASDTGENPKLIRIDSKAGHGAGKPMAKVIDEYADLYSFIFYNLGIVPETVSK